MIVRRKEGLSEEENFCKNRVTFGVQSEFK